VERLTGVGSRTDSRIRAAPATRTVPDLVAPYGWGVPPADRPTTDPRRPVIDSFGYVWEQLTSRLDGLTAPEMAWEPVANVWAVRPGPTGSAVADEHDPEAGPGPVPTINWRLWHMTVECLESYTDRAFGRTFASVSGRRWHLDPAAATADLELAYRGFLDACMERTAEQWWEQLGEQFGPWHAHNVYDLVEHAQHEIAHHGAEVALLRDLYRERFS
jgi:hypothetical protein